MAVESQIRRAAREAQLLLNGMYSDPSSTSGSALDQSGLRDGLQIVEDYLTHGEFGLALEHLLYMIEEPALKLSRAALTDLREAAAQLGLSEKVPGWMS